MVQLQRFNLHGWLKRQFLELAPDVVINHAKKIHYLKKLREFNCSDEPDLWVVDGLVRAGDVCVDIGANVGWYTKFMSDRVGAEGRIYSIEPVPITFSILSYAVNKLGLNNVELNNIALSSVQGEASMDIPLLPDAASRNYYMARIVTTSEHASKFVKVKLRTLDEVIGHDAKRISFVKCDVEGHEWPVIQGASDILTNSDAAWLIEISDNPEQESSSANLIFSRFRQMGYGVYYFDAASRVLKKYQPGASSINFFFLKENHLDDLGTGTTFDIEGR